jgi:5-methyltetrahydrofolate--homocysteine methyltransferase
VPVSQIIDAAEEHHADAIGLSALLVSTSKQMPACVGELHERGLPYPVLVGGAAINRDFGRRILYPHGLDADDVYEPGVFYCKDAFQGLAVMDELVDEDRREPLVERIRDEARRLRERPERPEVVPAPDAPSRSAVRTDVPVPEPPFRGARETEVPLQEVFPLLDTHVLFKLHWGGRGVKGEAWERLLRDDFGPRLERMWRDQDYLRPRAVYGYFPVAADGDELVFFDPDDPGMELERLSFPRQPAHDRLCLADYYRPVESGEHDVAVLQAVTVGPQVTERCEALEREGEFAEQLFTHGLGVQAAEGLAEWLHGRVRRELRIAPGQGRRYSWGYPACPDQSEHEKVFRLLDAQRIGLSLSGGWAVEPEQSTVAIVAHHPQATYFGMRSGRIPPDRARAEDDVVEEDEAELAEARAG